jgi:hypothetical protein
MLAGARPVRIKPKRISPHPAESPRRRPYAVRVGDFRVTVEPKLVRGGPNFRYFAVEPTGAPFVIPPAKNAPNRHPVRQIWCICAKRYLKTRYLRRFRDRRAPGLMCLSPWSRSPGLVAGSKEAQGAPRTPCRPNADGQLGASKKKKPWPTLPHLSRRLGDPTHSRASAPQMQDSDGERRKMAALRARTAALSTTFGSPAYARAAGFLLPHYFARVSDRRGPSQQLATSGFGLGAVLLLNSSEHYLAVPPRESTLARL